MANAYYHAVSSAKRWGGKPEEFLHLHTWMDEAKVQVGDFRHRALRHHLEGVKEMAEKFGPTLTLSTGRTIPVTAIGEQHLIEDFGRLPTVGDWLRRIQPEPWMTRARQLSKELEV